MALPLHPTKSSEPTDEEVVDLGRLSESVSDPSRGSSNFPKEVLPARSHRFTIQELPAELQFRSTQIHPDSELQASELQATLIHESSAKPAATPAYRPSVRPPMAVLQMIHDDQVNSTSYPLLKDRFRIGRMEGDITLPFDLWISGKHAEIQRRKRGESFYWMLVDLKSTNGTFIHSSQAQLQHGDELFLGQERYRFLIDKEQAGLSHITRGQGGQWWPKSDRFSIGKSTKNALRPFETDPYLDPVHANVFRTASGEWTIEDNRSRNGLWFRIDEAELLAECMFQLGEQRFCFTVPTADRIRR